MKVGSGLTTVQTCRLHFSAKLPEMLGNEDSIVFFEKNAFNKALCIYSEFRNVTIAELTINSKTIKRTF